MRRTYDVIVVGTRGAPLAMLLARKGHRVLVVSAPPSGTSVGAMAALERWGLGERFETLLVDAAILAGAQVREDFGAEEIADEHAIVVDAAEIQDALLDAESRANTLDETLRGGRLER
jgi:hypothetical protein